MFFTKVQTYTVGIHYFSVVNEKVFLSSIGDYARCKQEKQAFETMKASPGMLTKRIPQSDMVGILISFFKKVLGIGSS